MIGLGKLPVFFTQVENGSILRLLKPATHLANHIICHSRVTLQQSVKHLPGHFKSTNSCACSYASGPSAAGDEKTHLSKYSPRGSDGQPPLVGGTQSLNDFCFTLKQNIKTVISLTLLDQQRCRIIFAWMQGFNEMRQLIIRQISE